MERNAVGRLCLKTIRSVLVVLCFGVMLLAAGARTVIPEPPNNADNVGISSEDLLQDRAIIDLDKNTERQLELINKHIEATDTRVQNNGDKSLSLEAESGVWFKVLFMLLAGSVGMQVKASLSSAKAAASDKD